MAQVLVLQCLLFNDGGRAALGSNVLNMGVIGGMVGYLLMRGMRALLPVGRSGYLISAAVASWFSVVLASSACALELALSGTSPLRVVLPAMAGTHAIIGIGEALVATAVLAAVVAARPDIVPEWAGLDRKSGEAGGIRRSAWALAGAGLVVAAALAAFGSPFASKAPDGLDKKAEEQGFDKRASEEKKAPFSEYRVSGIKSEKVSTSLAGLIGTAAVFAAGLGVIRLVSGRVRRAEDRGA
jgi:cobalt/nickel transport system permease protein